MNFVIIRSEKIKADNVVSAHLHNTRSINVENSSGNAVETLIDYGDDLKLAIYDHIKNHGNKRAQIRSTSVLAQELVLSASPGYFRPECPEKAGYWDEKLTANWKIASLDFLKKRYGKNLLGVHVHYDESTPHMHAIVVPLTSDGRLSARDVFGENECRDYHTAYAESLKHLGLSRGIEGSTAKHQAVKKFYGAVNSPVPDIPAIDEPPLIGRKKWAEEQTKIVAEAVETLHAQATQTQFWKNRAKEEKQARAIMAEKLNDMKKTSAQLKDIKLSKVLEHLGYVADLEKHGINDTQTQYRQGKGKDGKYYGDRLSVNLDKNVWFDHSNGVGGSGSIDLVMHTNGCHFKDAKSWLICEFGSGDALGAAHVKTVLDFELDKKNNIQHAPPKPVVENLAKVKSYLVNERLLDSERVDKLANLGLIYADARNNACFVYGTTKNPSGVELRGTVGIKYNRFRGRKTASFKPPSKPIHEIKKIAITESAIEAMSYSELHPDHYAISISGSGNHEIMNKLVKFAKDNNKDIVVALNNDDAGHKAAKILLKECKENSVNSVIATPWGDGNDWNDCLKNIKAWLKSNKIAINEIAITEKHNEMIVEYEKTLKNTQSIEIEPRL